MFIEIIGVSGVGKSTMLTGISQKLSDIGIDSVQTISADLKKLKSQISDNEKRLNIDLLVSDELANIIIKAIVKSEMTFSQRLMSFRVLDTALSDLSAFIIVKEGKDVVFDEFLIHKSFLLFANLKEYESLAKAFFSSVQVPDAVFILKAEIELVLDRIHARDKTVNSYRYASDDEIKVMLARMDKVYEIAETVLTKRGVYVDFVECNGSVEENKSLLFSKIKHLYSTSPDQLQREVFKRRLQESSESFKISDGRHYLKTKDIIYCSFKGPKISFARDECQRDAQMRFNKFLSKGDSLAGKTVLDLGSNNGAMLIHSTNFEIDSGLGVEYDLDKVELANDLAEFNGISNLTFKQGDIDEINEQDIGCFDVVFSLAIEKHLKDRLSLYNLLGKITSELLFFEGNAGCDLNEVKALLSEAGFRKFDFLGNCDDDIRKENNKRPMLIARK